MADIICRWRNGTPQTVVELVNSLPHEKMSNEQFRLFMQSSIWGHDFFRTAYQLACQLGLYYESEDGCYYPRFDHDITELEAKEYLEFWLTRYYVPNPYIGKNGFNQIECPTYVLSELYKYAKDNSNCTYYEAYKAIFKEEANNNTDIVRNYINNFSKVLYFEKNGQLSITSINPNEIFDFMDRNDKKAFFDNFTRNNKEGSLLPLQTIYYGTPGSGKSHKVKGIVKDVDEDFVFRTTFHPDSDYASFVGCYKPVMKHNNRRVNCDLTVNDLAQKLRDYYNVPRGGQIDGLRRFCYEFSNCIKKIDVKKLVELAAVSDHFDGEIKKYLSYGDLFPVYDNSKISYEFTPQTFTKAYVAAWNNPEQQIYLIIEEINRGNCAQIFGDLFQLLDRENGVSEYPIDADNDLKDYLEQELGAGHEGIKNGKLKLPSNLNILATMNTSDQSLFPMDSAFKRRWAWECVPVDYTNSVSGKFTIKIGDSEYKWHDFLLKANNRIKDLTFSEDKQMGNFFISSNVDKRQFIDKVMFYLWNDICKDEYGSGSFFRRYIDNNNPESEFSFNDLFGEENKIETILNDFMKYLAVEKIEAATSTGEEQ